MIIIKLTQKHDMGKAEAPYDVGDGTQAGSSVVVKLSL